MSLTDRDRKIVLVLIPLLMLAGYWFLVLTPKRSESAKVAEKLAKARGERDTAQAQVGQLNAAKASFASDYQTVIRMGKAVPENVDMPSLLVQLDRAARGTGVDMREIKVEPKTETGVSSTPPGGGGNPGAGGSGAESSQGKAAQGAGNAVNQANDKSQQSADAGNAAPSSGSGGPPASASQSAPGLSAVGLTFQLGADFFDMADFFHRMKRFVRVVNDQVVVRGRLIAIDSFTFNTDESGEMKAEVAATVYLSPKAEGGVDAGASPSGPSGTPPTGGNIASDPAGGQSSPPTAATTP